MRNRIAVLLAIIVNLLIQGCSSTAHHPSDPLEKMNRRVYGFNKAIDKAVTKPVAYVYWRYLPKPMQAGIGNFYDNLKEIPNVANDVLQFRFGYAARDSSRFLVNSTIGILGFIDVAGRLGLPHRKNDFGQTLYRWGYKKSAYLVLPILGPSSFRDGFGLLVDYTGLSIWPWIESKWRYPLLAVDAIDTRARLLRSETVIDAVAIDEYEFIRDAYFQRREYLFNQANQVGDEANLDDDMFNEPEIEGEVKPAPAKNDKPPAKNSAREDYLEDKAELVARLP